MDAQASFLEQLFAAGLLIDTGVPGLYGRSGAFEAVIDRFESLLDGLAGSAERLRFPPGMNQAQFARSGYMKSFPQLAGAVHSFCGDAHAHGDLMSALETGQPWGHRLSATAVALTPATCYPLYPIVAARGALKPEGGHFDLQSYCFRHEPSHDPARMQMFRQREFVRIGSPEQVLAFRQDWLARGQALINRLELPFTLDLANDPFFGRGGKIMAIAQREQQLKFELLVPITSEAHPTACLSFNYHQDHFGQIFGIQGADGAVAHTACVGFGLERVALALFRHHSLDVADWPASVREALWGVSQDACFPALRPQTHRPYRLNDQDRLWPLTNCSVDLWIPVIDALGLEPEAMLGFTVLLDFEGDHFTFFKPPFEDLHTLYGLTVQELAIYDAIESHVVMQLARGRLCLVEVDSFFLPDTRGVSYRLEPGKTTIGINRLDIAGRRLEYFHNGGYHALEGDDFDGLMRGYAYGDIPFRPYAEFVKFGAPLQGDGREHARMLLARHLGQRPDANPIRAFQAVLPEQARAVAERETAFFHRYAFHGLRQLGANFELLADHLIWLDGSASEASSLALRIAETAKAAQFQLARACARKRFDALPASVEAAAEAYDALFARLTERA